MEINNKRYQGLSSQEVEERIAQGKVNIVADTITKSYKEIFLSNTLTFFNFINIVLLSLIILVGSYKNGLFIFIIIINTTAGIYQEVKAKKTLDTLSILTTTEIDVLRAGQIVRLPIHDIVLDDCMVLVAGNQIPTDAVVIEGQLEVNEALLTGESDGVVKLTDDNLYSGSFVTSGKALCQVIHVGEDNYMQQITKEAKRFKKHSSQLNRSLDSILKIIGVMIIPLGILLFLKQFYISEHSLQDSVTSTVAAALGMIPEGLVLLTSVALTISVLRLAKRKTLVQELYCIETLARVDTLCLDKTGTITEGKMRVEKVDTLRRIDVEEVMSNLMFCLTDSNVTSQALQDCFSAHKTYNPYFVIPFSSDRKYSGVAFREVGTYYIGALQFLFPKGNEELEERCYEYTRKGYRALVLAHHKDTMVDEELPSQLEACAIILLSDVIREDASDTLRYFKEQGVRCKVISGDDPITVASIAKKAGVDGANAYIDATKLTTKEEIKEAVDKYHIFGRVTPKQKKEMVICLKELGHTVAMTGDGVNDVLAFKEADCSIAMAAGSDAAKQAANLVLLDNNFNAMPHIVNEGRRVINNITMSASMFLIKTIFSACIAIVTIVIGQSYPFEPIQLSVISACSVGIPSFFLTYESNFQRVKGSFLKTVFSNAFPPAITISIGTIVFINIGLLIGHQKDTLATMCVIFTAWNYMLALKHIYTPLTNYRKYVLYATQIMYFTAMIIGRDILGLAGLSYIALVILIGMICLSPMYNDITEKLFFFLYKQYRKTRLKTYIKNKHSNG